MKSYKHPQFFKLKKRLKDSSRFIQVLSGPRQVGKTTLIHQVLKDLGLPCLYATADELFLQSPQWIYQQWEAARELAKKEKTAILVLDEVQKIKNWSERVKLLWDEDQRKNISLKTVLLGSSPLLMKQGLGESLTGRFEVLPMNHWSFQEMKTAFHFTLEEYIYFGGYPGAAPFIKDEERWKEYIIHSFVETALSKDIHSTHTVHKPALMRQLYQLSCEFSGQILSYQKMLGQLQDSGNTTTLAHYLHILSTMGMVCGLAKYSPNLIRKRSSSPKLQVYNTALMSVFFEKNFQHIKKDKKLWGRLVESCIGTHLANHCLTENIELYYWREAQREVDFVFKKRNKVIALEVKSNLVPNYLEALEFFRKKYNPYKCLVIGKNGLSLDDFLSQPVSHWFTD